MSAPDLRHARIRITLTPPLTMVAQDADAAGISEALRQQYAAHIGTAKRDGRSVESVTIETDNTR